MLDLGTMRALGFCVSIEHARYMARKFTDAGLESIALTGEDPPDVRSATLARLRSGDLRCIFSVEVLGEGVDVPDVDCLLLLRPTSSATVFSQQLGRGLRRAKDKSHLTVVDMIGQHRREFRFEDRLRAILDPRRGRVLQQVEADFPFLPAGCTIDLDRQSRELILGNLRETVGRSRWSRMVADLRSAPDVGLAEFLDQFGHRIEDVYRGDRSWTRLQREANRVLPAPSDPTAEARMLRALGRLTHLDDPERIAFYTDVLEASRPPNEERVRPRASADAHDARLGPWIGDIGCTVARRVLRGVLGRDGGPQQSSSSSWVYSTSARRRDRGPALLPAEVPLTLHARYSRQEVIAALGFGDGVKPKVTQGGILWVPQAESDVFFVDLQKAERDYSPTTMYRDYAINRELFHWESQSRQTPRQPTVRRYITHRAGGTNVLLFVRERKTFELGTQPFTFLGPVTLRRTSRRAPRSVHVGFARADAGAPVRSRSNGGGGLTTHRRSRSDCRPPWQPPLATPLLPESHVRAAHRKRGAARTPEPRPPIREHRNAHPR